MFVSIGRSSRVSFLVPRRCTSRDFFGIERRLQVEEGEQQFNKFAKRSLQIAMNEAREYRAGR